MRQGLMVLLLCALMIIPAAAQKDTPDYALAFRAGNEVRVATFSEVSGWDVETLPNFLLFGQYDISLVLPKWTTDGQLIGTGYAPEVGAEEPEEGGLAAYLYRYDVLDQTMESMAEPIEEAKSDEMYMPPTLAISAISPDGRYITLHDLLRVTGYVINLDEQRVIYATDECGLKGFRWTESSVFVGSHAAYITCEPEFFELDLASGERLNDFSEMLAGQDITMFEEGLALENGTFLMSAYGMEDYYKLVEITPEGATIITSLGFDGVIASESGRAAAFSGDPESDDSYSLMYLDLQTHEVTELVNADTTSGYFFDGQTLHYGGSERIGDRLKLFKSVYATGIRPEILVLYEGAVANNYVFSPGIEQVAVSQGNQVQVFGETGIIWDSREAGLELAETYPVWSENGDWLYLFQETGTISVNPQTEEIVMPPEEYARFLSASPEGRWWLYIVREPGDDMGMYQSERLFVYDRETQEMVTLSNDKVLYDNFHWALESLFVWSPVFE